MKYMVYVHIFHYEIYNVIWRLITVLEYFFLNPENDVESRVSDVWIEWGTQQGLVYRGIFNHFSFFSYFMGEKQSQNGSLVEFLGF